jgi:catechol 2,3-dioxygenase-like lactoylglutathione lyase family enzyme
MSHDCNVQEGQLHHVEIYLADLEKSRSFWDWFLPELGYKVFQQWDLGISYILGQTYLVFVQADADQQTKVFNRRQPGLNHLAFYVEDKIRLDELCQCVKDRGLRLLYTDLYPHAGGRDQFALYFEEPDGLKIELVAAKQA